MGLCGSKSDQIIPTLNRESERALRYLYFGLGLAVPMPRFPEASTLKHSIALVLKISGLPSVVPRKGSIIRGHLLRARRSAITLTDIRLGPIYFQTFATKWSKRASRSVRRANWSTHLKGIASGPYAAPARSQAFSVLHAVEPGSWG